MKKLIALAGAAAMMLASTGVAFGAFIVNNQAAFQNTKGAAISNTGLNFSSGAMSFQGTGMASSYSESVSSANDVKVYTNDSFTFVSNDQVAFQNTKGAAISNTGLNFSGGMLSGQMTGPAFSYSSAGSAANWAVIKTY
jgi:archaellum component FlaF (FlaF/FlaG flagellin family)